MTLKTVWDIIHAILKKESTGNVIKPDRFTYLLQQCHLEYYNQQYQKWAGSQRILDSMRPFVVVDESLLVVTGTTDVDDLDYPYQHLIGAYVASYADAGPGVIMPTNVPVDIVTPLEWIEWATDSVMAGTSQYPLMTCDGESFHFVGAGPSGANVKISYLVRCELDVKVGGTYPDAGEFFLPFFDYYLDANYNVVYLPNNVSRVLAAGEEYRDGTTTGTKVGISHELLWGDSDIVNIISMLIQKIAVGMQDVNVAQYAMAQEQKQNVM